uniref:Uncharacterized protein n=1 Tax=Cacopsylla melanoneura TaxID=428564 RepID=A0A8D8QQP2_9HEMI
MTVWLPYLTLHSQPLGTPQGCSVMFPAVFLVLNFDYVVRFLGGYFHDATATARSTSFVGSVHSVGVTQHPCSHLFCVVFVNCIVDRRPTRERRLVVSRPRRTFTRRRIIGDNCGIVRIRNITI